MLEFRKTKIESTKGMQPSKWDVLADELTEPGDTAEFEESVVSKAQASQGAARLRKLTGKPYHSGYHVVNKTTFIRLRMPDEVAEKEHEND